jgi:HK97 family phage major capsid protein
VNYDKLATAALEKRASLIAEIRSIEADTVLSDAEKRERVEQIDADVTALEADARSYVERSERETEARSLAGRNSGLIVAGRPSDAPAYRHSGEWLAAELRAITGGSGAGAAFTPSANADFYFDRLRAESVFLKSGVQVIKTDRDSLNIPRLLTGAVADFVAEASAITTGDATADVVTALPRKIGHLVTMSAETIDDSIPELLKVYGDEMVKTIGLRFDIACFQGTGTAPQIRGLANVSGINVQSMGANGSTPTNVDFIADALTTIEIANGTPGAVVMSPRTWGTLKKLKEVSGSNKPILQDSSGSVSQGIQRSLYGCPVYLSSQLSVTETSGTSTDCSSVYVYDPSQVYAVMRNEVAIQEDRSQLFSTDQVQVRALMRADMVVSQPSAVVRITGVRP